MNLSEVENIIIINESILEIIETHISLLLLTKQYVYKMKKSIQFSFVDLSTIEKRKYLCEEELRLNQRLTTGMYLEVVSINKIDNKYFIGKSEGEIVDYALKMKRIESSKQMHLLLQKNKVSQDDIERIVEVLVPFHQNAKIISRPFSILEMKDNFNDIESVQFFIKKELGDKYKNIIKSALHFSNDFLEKNISFFKTRIQSNMIREVHGDLHSSNIFIDVPPIIFDCIEFNSKFREIDILNELAFFCMDLEAYEQEGLSAFFMEKYLQLFPQVLKNEQDAELFLYYKLYRSNVRAKVHVLKAQHLPKGRKKKEFLSILTIYLQLMEKYLSILVK